VAYSGEIRIAYDVVQDQETRIRNLSVQFGNARTAHFNAGPVDHAYAEMLGRCSDRESQLQKGLTGLADTLAKIRQTFQQAETELVEMLQSPRAKNGGAP
jgi:hypothetical protein